MQIARLVLAALLITSTTVALGAQPPKKQVVSKKKVVMKKASSKPTYKAQKQKITISPQSLAPVKTSAPSTNLLAQYSQLSHNLAVPLATATVYIATNLGEGTGFFVSKKGYIVTPEHVIDGASAVNVTLITGGTYSAKVVYADVNNDVAILKINGAGNFPYLSLQNFSTVLVGNYTLACGFPLGLDTEVFVQGIVSVHARKDLGTYPVDGFLQIDTATTPGCSGSPYVDYTGKVIGMDDATLLYPTTTPDGTSTQYLQAENLALAIPSVTIQRALTTYAAKAHISY